MHRLKEENMLLKSQVNFQKHQLQQSFHQVSAFIHQNSTRQPSTTYQKEKPIDEVNIEDLNSSSGSSSANAINNLNHNYLQSDEIVSSHQQPYQLQQSQTQQLQQQQLMKRQLQVTDMKLVKIAQQKLMKENKSLKKRVDQMQGQMNEIFEIIVDEKQNVHSISHHAPAQSQSQLLAPNFTQAPQFQSTNPNNNYESLVLQSGDNRMLNTESLSPPARVSFVEEEQPHSGDSNSSKKNFTSHFHHSHNHSASSNHPMLSKQPQSSLHHHTSSSVMMNHSHSKSMCGGISGGQGNASTSRIMTSNNINNNNSMSHNPNEGGELVEKVEVTKREFLKKIKDVFEKHQSQNDIFVHKNNQMKQHLMDSKLLITESDDVTESIVSSRSHISSHSFIEFDDTLPKQQSKHDPPSQLKQQPQPQAQQHYSKQLTLNQANQLAALPQPTALFSADSKSFHKKAVSAHQHRNAPPTLMEDDDSRNETTSEFAETNRSQDSKNNHQLFSAEPKPSQPQLNPSDLALDSQKQQPSLQSQQTQYLQPQQQQKQQHSQRIAIPPPIDFATSKRSSGHHLLGSTTTNGIPSNSSSYQFSQRSNRSAHHDPEQYQAFHYQSQTSNNNNNSTHTHNLHHNPLVLEVVPPRATFRGFGGTNGNEAATGVAAATSRSKASEYRSIKEQYQSVLNSQSQSQSSSNNNGSLSTTHLNASAGYSSAIRGRYDHLQQFQVQKNTFAIANQNNNQSHQGGLNSAAAIATAGTPSTAAPAAAATANGNHGISTNTAFIMNDLKRRIDDHLSFDSSRKELPAPPPSTTAAASGGGQVTSRNYESVPAGSTGRETARGSLTAREFATSGPATTMTSSAQFNEKITDEYIKSIIQQYKTPKKTIVPPAPTTSSLTLLTLQQQSLLIQPSNTKKPTVGTSHAAVAAGTTQPVEAQTLNSKQSPQPQTLQQVRQFSGREGTTTNNTNNNNNNTKISSSTAVVPMVCSTATSSLQQSPTRFSKPTSRISFQAPYTGTHLNSGGVTGTITTPQSSTTPSMLNMLAHSSQQPSQHPSFLSNTGGNQLSQPQQAASQTTSPFTRLDVNSYSCYFGNTMNHTHAHTQNPSPLNRKINSIQPQIGPIAHLPASASASAVSGGAAAVLHHNPAPSSSRESLNLNHKRQQSCGTGVTSVSTSAAAVGAATKFNLKLNLSSLVTPKQMTSFQTDRQFSDRPNYTNARGSSSSSQQQQASSSQQSSQQQQQQYQQLYPSSTTSKQTIQTPSLLAQSKNGLLGSAIQPPPSSSSLPQQLNKLYNTKK